MSKIFWNYYQPVLILAAFGGIFILWYLNVNYPHIFGPQEIIQDYLVYITFLALFWYSIEARGLRIDEFLPVMVVLTGGTLTADATMSIKIQNLGKGIAKDLTIKVGGVEVISDAGFGPNEPAVVLGVVKNRGRIQNLVSDGRKSLKIEINYKDIGDRKYATYDDGFELQPDGSYKLIPKPFKFVRC